MQQFIADIVGETILYPSADPYQPVNVLCQGDGDRSAWHFDSDNAFTMTLMLQARLDFSPEAKKAQPGAFHSSVNSSVRQTFCHVCGKWLHEFLPG
ncbi:MAG: hypothetical protein GY785_18490 [Gammaproteobacteria bacterium]|nr:hypothetical protein [Gammaproteobacteria bacterium]